MFQSEKGARGGLCMGLALDKGFRGHVERKSLISLAQIQATKEIRSRNKSTKVHALRARKSHDKVSK